MTVKGRWFADEAVVAVKLKAYDDMVTCLRIKLSESDGEKKKTLEVKGGTCKRKYNLE